MTASYPLSVLPLRLTQQVATNATSNKPISPRSVPLIVRYYGVASINRMHKNIGLFCKRALQKRPIFCKETYILKHPINRSHPISAPSTSPTHFFLPSCFAPQVARHGRLLRRLPLLRRLSQPRPISFLFPFYYPFLRLLTAPAATSTTFFASPHSHFFFLRSVPTAASTASTYFHKMFDPIISNSFPVRYYGISGTNLPDIP